jgi:hypothetical protein
MSGRFNKKGIERMRKDYIPKSAGNLRTWLNNFAEKLPPRAAHLGVLPEEIEQLKADARVYDYACDIREQVGRKDREWTAFMSLVKTGSGANDIPMPLPVAEPPPSVPAGILERVRYLAGRIKSHRCYTEAVGKDLGLVGALSAAILNPETLQPDLTVRLMAGRPVVTWTRNGTDALEIECDRGSGVFERIAVALGMRYVDPAPLPAGNTGVLWKYRGTYRRMNELVGKTSDPVSIGVFGQTEAAA